MHPVDPWITLLLTGSIVGIGALIVITTILRWLIRLLIYAWIGIILMLLSVYGHPHHPPHPTPHPLPGHHQATAPHHTTYDTEEDIDPGG